MIPFQNVCRELKNLWFTGCTHYNHKNMCKGETSWEYPHTEGCRTFHTLEQMNQSLIEGINKYIKEDDVLIQLGDWSFGGKEKAIEFRERLNVKTIHAIEGNHCHNFHKYEDLRKIFTTYQQLGYFSCEGIQFFCSHYPNVVFHQSHKGAINCYSHVHNSYTHPGKALDCGMDSAFAKLGEYRPFNALEVIEYVKNREILLESHHNSKTN